MVECLFPGKSGKPRECTCSLRETLRFMKGTPYDPGALQDILGRACPNKPPEQKEQEKKKSPKA